MFISGRINTTNKRSAPHQKHTAALDLGSGQQSNLNPAEVTEAKLKINTVMLLLRYSVRLAELNYAIIKCFVIYYWTDTDITFRSSI